ncbi:hypothetical protein Pst134EA_021421 [Puccinia striiformis f. sp. tritici]|uniref:hypothetical protein n=1 Tax=Puccinia striiformis f. sp. tritici TaxID=168172 RepID=UPI0020080162|nr:hypothetical protein Pst134EA_021421 [Puccinia striiformis f. sp. tritici]KAH9457546.1 hypothetical protein Pst134EA_021421 [Puccinia striiformis f. sp. tritici]
MKRPILLIAVLSCLLLVSILPVHSMETVEEFAEGGKLAKATKTGAGEGPKVGDMREPLLAPNQHPSPQHLEAEMFHGPHSDRPLEPLPSRYNRLTKKIKFTFLKNIYKKYFFVPRPIKDFYKLMTKGFVIVDRPMGKSARIPSYASYDKTPKWEEMEKDIPAMIEALAKYDERDLLTQISTHGKLNPRVTPGFQKHPEEKTTRDFINDARNELEKLNGPDSIYEPRQKERQMLLVKSLLSLSRKEEFRQDVLIAMDAVMNHLALREQRGEALPKATPYIKAAHYLMTSRDRPSEETLSFARRLLKTSVPADGDLEAHLERQNLDMWLQTFRRQGDGYLQGTYQAMLAGHKSHAETFGDVFQWSAYVLDPLHSHNYPSADLLFALETLYVHSVEKAKAVDGYNPAFNTLLSIRNKWLHSNSVNQAVPAAVDVTAHMIVKKAATPLEDHQVLALVAKHRMEFMPPQEPEKNHAPFQMHQEPEHIDGPFQMHRGHA